MLLSPTGTGPESTQAGRQQIIIVAHPTKPELL